MICRDCHEAFSWLNAGRCERCWMLRTTWWWLSPQPAPNRAKGQP